MAAQALTDAEMDALAVAARPLVRLRDTWILVDDASIQRAAHPLLAPLEPVDALGAALTGSVTIDGTPGSTQGLRSCRIRATPF
ncbi:SNF2 helicase-associated domain-containing protein [Embleya sp. NPDC127516]|uniref:SNF2 helicase-associated domain-containing protein n=1 Tax=Embleya sp. NPDC127516 TaxID=3363990 RepID=UPI0038211163